MSYEEVRQEQATLQRAMEEIDLRLKALEKNYHEVLENLDTALDLVTSVGKLYKNAPEPIKRIINQVFLDSAKVYAHDDVQPQKSPLYEALLSARTKQLATTGELFPQLSQKLLSYANSLSKHLLVRVRRL